jgi:hypothetical protein
VDGPESRQDGFDYQGASW